MAESDTIVTDQVLENEKVLEQLPDKDSGTVREKSPEVLESDIVREIYCQPCGFDEKQRDAYGFCRDCGEFLCKDCYTYHKKLTICRHHILLDRASMPNEISGGPVKDMCTQRCAVHPDEIVKYYCFNHKKLGCSACITLHHRACEDTDYVPAVSKGFLSTKEYKDFNIKLENMKRTSKHIITVTRENVERSAEYYAQAMQNVKKLRQELERALDQLENDVKKQTERLEKEDTERMTSISRKCETVLTDIEELLSEFQHLESKSYNSQLFVSMKSAIDKVTKLENILKELENKNITKYDFHTSSEIRNILNTPNGMGGLFKWDLKGAWATHMADICVKTDSDRNTCCITGSVMLSADKLVIADRINDKLKLVNVKQNELIFEMELPSSPWDLAEISTYEFALTLPKEKKILFITCDGCAMTTERELKVNCECLGIAFNNEKLIVTHENPGTIQIMDMAGSVLQTFSKDDQGKELFKTPSYTAVSADFKTIYVADWDQNSVTSLDTDGKVKYVYKDEDLAYPGKLVVDRSGLVTVCGINSSNVHLISSECTKIQILSNTNELDHPRTLSYSDDNERVYVGMWDNDNVRVYKLS